MAELYSSRKPTWDLGKGINAACVENRKEKHALVSGQ